MKKSSLPHYLFPITYLFWLLPVASAGPVDGVRQLTDGFREVLYILFQFVGDTIFQIDSFDEFLFAKLLLFSLVLLITYTVISRNTIFGGRKNKSIQWIVSSAIAILSIRYLPDEFVQAILLQYSALAVGLTVFLPLSIYFFFLHQSGIGPFGRRLGWLVYIVSFLSLWLIRWRDMSGANIIYLIGIAFVIASMLFDTTIHKHLGLRKIKKVEDSARVERRVHADTKLKELEERRDFYTEAEYKSRKDILEKAREDNLPR